MTAEEILASLLDQSTTDPRLAVLAGRSINNPESLLRALDANARPLHRRAIKEAEVIDAYGLHGWTLDAKCWLNPFGWVYVFNKPDGTRTVLSGEAFEWEELSQL